MKSLQQPANDVGAESAYFEKTAGCTSTPMTVGVSLPSAENLLKAASKKAPIMCRIDLSKPTQPYNQQYVEKYNMTLLIE